MMKHAKLLLAMQFLSIAVFQVKATKDIEDYYGKVKRAADGRIPTGGYYEKVKRDLSEEVEEYEDDDDEDTDNRDYSDSVHRTRKQLDEEKEKREYEYYPRGKFARDIDDYVR